jgi:hypothetical protein
MDGPDVATPAAVTSMPPRSRGRESVSSPQHRAGDAREGIFQLPAGYLGADGTLHTEARLAPLTGHDEEFLTSLSGETCSAAAVTMLLGRCLKRVGLIEPVDDSVVRGLLVCDRDYLMLKLREMTFGARVDAVLGCRACGRRMDVTFSLEDVGVESRPLPQRFFSAELSPSGVFRDGEGVEHREVEFRLPTGADQEAAAVAFDEDERAALELLFARLVRPAAGVVGQETGEVRETAREAGEAFAARLPEAARSEIELCMRRLAPSVEVDLDGACPECGEPFETSFDLTTFFAAEMQNNLRGLERAVHLLAFHYHWSEGEILSLTRRKRQRYVEMVEEELAR